ncbi:MAG: peptide chain release factor N(5)-glutamine methyltransferase [Chloroflexi bacterium]|nr:peptide chain release factor N(5)-glutamine methyltransferase [Chloroflexota bacterium]
MILDFGFWILDSGLGTGRSPIQNPESKIQNPTPGSVGECLQWTSEALRKAGIEQPRFEAGLLVALALETRREWVLAHPEQRLTAGQQARLAALARRRLAHEPLAYLRGEQEFYGRSFLVDGAVLIPRPETELLVEVALQACDRARARGNARPLAVDVGAGSGAVAVTVALERPWARMVALDLSARALEVARRNAQRLGAGNVCFVQADLLAPLRGPVDLLVGNLPYIPDARWPTLQPELHYEPRLAILGGPSGLELVARALDQARGLLAPGGEVALEIDETQGAAALELAARAFPNTRAVVLKDYAGLDRVLHVRPG